MIASFANAAARAAWERRYVKGYSSDVLRIAHRKLLQLQNAQRLDDLRAPPGNRLEALSGDRAGLHSIRINDQWRICFRWREGDAHDVALVGYH